MILVIAEKPSVAKEIAKVVGADQTKKGYLHGNGYLVSWCFGHLIELAEPAVYDPSLGKWQLDTLPIVPKQYQTVVSSGKADQFQILQELMHRTDVTELIAATDAGREGELIFRLVYEKAGCKKPFRRLWISSLEEKSIRDGLANAKPGSEYDSLYHAALCRQRADWLLGINMTRLYSVMYHKKLPYGRVQTPTINLIAQRQEDIENFIPQKYYSIKADLGAFKVYTKVSQREKALTILQNCSGAEAYVVSVKKENKKDKAPALYDLTTLQRDANRLLGYSAQQTLDVMQSLYESKLATYPRTDSRYLTSDQEASTLQLIETLLHANIFSSEAANAFNPDSINIFQVINDSKVTDHHAILPTKHITAETLHSLPTAEKSILQLILHRLLESVCPPHTYTQVKVVVDIDGEAFSATGREEGDPGFTVIGPALKDALGLKEKQKSANEEDLKTQNMPPVSEGNSFTVRNITTAERKTTPPAAYTEDTLLRAMETAGADIDDSELREAMKDSGLGTTATRAGIIESIIATGYVKREGKKLLPTQLAKAFLDVVSAENLKSPKMTAEWERQLAQIQQGEISANSFMSGITGFVSTFVSSTKELYMPEIDGDTFKNIRESVGSCPCCGKRVVEYSKSYSCESGKDGCGFTVWKTILGKNITQAQIKKLLTTGKTDIIKGFTSKAGKSFDARLVIEKGSTQPKFEFSTPQKVHNSNSVLDRLSKNKTPDKKAIPENESRKSQKPHR